MRTLTLEPISPNMACSTFSQRLEWAKKRIDALEQFRTQQILKHSDEHFRLVFSLLPLLIHYNHPELPAYVENVPQGIANFQPNNSQKAFLRKRLSEIEMAEFITQPEVKPVFDGLYVMGSIGSITQTRFSDLDLWLCHSQRFNRSELQLIEHKLKRIKSWAEDLGVEVNFYLMNPVEFQAKAYQSDTDAEHNGSAQHFFLLDEFYRSAIRLAGKRILWLHIDKQEQRYQDLLEQAVKNSELNLEEWIDFGDFSALSIGEFFGASLWQLYKGITSPYKSAIKILLLESYTQTYPKVSLISKKFKQLLLSPCGICYHFDPYLAMLEQVTDYLHSQNAIDRLQFLRHCFYIKSNEGQTDPCRKKALKLLASEWQWKEKEIAILNNRRHWKVKRIASHHKKIVDQLLLSYRNLLQFVRKLQIDPNIMPQDADFLMRQLYSAFEHTQGKVELINEKRISDLSEENLTFIEVAEGGAVKQGWYVLNHAPFSEYDSTKRYVQYQPNLVMAVAWAYFNGLINANTLIHLVNERLNLAHLREFITDLRLYFPQYSPKVVARELHYPNEIRNLIVAVNLLKDPTKQMPTFDKREIEQLDFFNLNALDSGMIGSISIIYRNMWNEVMTHHFEGSNVLFKALKLISNKIYRSSAPPESVNVFCYSEQVRNEIQQFVLNLVNRCITVKTGSIFQRYQPQIVKMAGKSWQLIFNEQQELKEIVEEKVAQDCCELPIVPQEIYSFASEGFLQFFFDDNQNGSFNVYVLDKQNKTECYHYCRGSKHDKIRAVSRLYAQDNVSLGIAGSFNFPQFYQILRDQSGKTENLVIVPFQSKQHRDFLDEQSDKQNNKETLCPSKIQS